MGRDDGLIHSYLLDGRGGARAIDWAGVRAWQSTEGTLWVHLDRGEESTEHWLQQESGLEPLIVEALLEPETRPRYTALPGGWLVVMRGVNLNPGADPEDMVALRMWIDPHRVLTVRRRRLMAVLDVEAALAAGRGPCDAGGLLVALADRLVERMGPVVAQLDEQLDGLECDALQGAGEALRMHLAGVRRQAIVLRRHIAPQRDALVGLITAQAGVLGDEHRLQLREVVDHVTRYVEDLDALRERAAVTNDELTNRAAEEMNRRMYILSLVAAVFLPLGLITGLLGVNVGGVPGTNYEWGFWILSGGLVAIGVLTTVFLNRLF
ncbi:MAG TPA: zinc transporter ZntB [Candidatus Dormibacteraeota bacterium]|nr:zinc transporter ZntB [Candidatus Dormibacteraeota bacterium]